MLVRHLIGKEGKEKGKEEAGGVGEENKVNKP